MGLTLKDVYAVDVVLHGVGRASNRDERFEKIPFSIVASGNTCRTARASSLPMLKISSPPHDIWATARKYFATSTVGPYAVNGESRRTNSQSA